MSSHESELRDTKLRVVFAEDDATSRVLLASTLQSWGYSVEAAADGNAALELLEQPETPQLAILDWMMPGLDGPELCRRARESEKLRGIYIIMLTSRDSSDALTEALSAGADDYVTKPFEHKELRARLGVGARILALQSELSGRVKELEEALDNINQLQGLLPICSYCSKIRDDGDYWQKVENYISHYTQVQFSHAICPDCYENAMKEVEALQSAKQQH